MRFLSFSLAPHALYWLLPSAVALVLLALWAYRAIAPSLPRRTRSTLTLLRAAALVGMAFLLARPLLSLAEGMAGRGTVVVLTDVSRSMELPADSIGGAHARTRAAVATVSAERAVRALSGHYRVIERSFAGGVFAAHAPDSTLGAARERTALGDALASALTGVDNARGVVVVSDGASTAGADPVASARELGLPVATLAVGRTPGADVAVLDVLSNPTARVGQETPVDVRVRALGPPRRTRLTLMDGERELAAQDIDLPGGGAEVVKRMTYRPTRPGLSVFEARVPTFAGEWSAVDDRRAYAQEVLPDRQRVLVLAGSYHWDWTWIARAIDGDSAYAATHLVYARGRFAPVKRSGAAVGRGGAAGAAAGLATVPTSAAQLRPYALCVLVGIEPGQLPASTLAALAEFATAGGSLAVLGGASRSGVLAFASTRLGDALALDDGLRGVGLKESAVALTREGRDNDLLRLDDDPATNAALWSALPPLSTLEPLSTRAEDRVDLTDATGKLPVLFERKVGHGRALIVNGSGMYRWGFAAGDEQAPRRFDRLWGNVLRELSEPAQTTPLRLVPESPLVARGEPVRMNATLQDAAFKPVNGARVTLRVKGPVARALDLAPAGDGGYGAALDGLPPGRYDASASATVGGRSVGDATATFWVDPQSAEWEDTSPDPGLLAAVARASGGAALAPGQEDRIAPAFAAPRPRAGRENALRLWESPLVFALATALLTTEWWMRRKRGLA